MKCCTLGKWQCCIILYYRVNVSSPLNVIWALRDSLSCVVFQHVILSGYIAPIIFRMSSCA